MDVGGLEVDKMVRATSSNVLRRITTLLIICCLLTAGLCVNTAAALPGSGTQEDPWRIESLADFDEFAADPNYWAGFTRLETDVNLAGRTYSTAIIAPDVNNVDFGFQGSAFTGVFDGDDHKIINLTIDDGGAGNDHLGLFGYIEDGEVKNLRLEGGSVSGIGWYVGGLLGDNWGSVSHCYSTGSVSGGRCVGGLVGWNPNGSVSNCYSTGYVIGSYEVGGLVGENDGSIWNCYSTGYVIGSDCVAGLVGVNGGTGIISYCYSTGNVSGDYEVGGLAGSNISGASISNCYSTADVSGDNLVGGIVGRNGFSFGIYPSYPGYIYNSYSTGNIQGAGNVGGLVGYNHVGEIEKSFWDLETSGDPNMCGFQGGLATGCDPNCGKTTAEMQTKTTFTDAGWDFVDIWLINEGATYPVLRQEIRSDLNGGRGVDLLDFAVFADHWLEGKL